MPGVYQLSVDEMVREAEQLAAAGVGGVILFGIPAEKDSLGRDAYSESGIVQQAVRALKRATPDLLIVSDVCFCEYTDHGHCGVVNQATGRTDVDNDATLALLAKQVVSHAQAGIDMVAPSGMMDGMVGAIRQALDRAGFAHLPVMSYAAKYASAFYGPFRDAAESAPAFGDRRTYQMDPATDPGQALREVELDLVEGADIIMIKPALAYLDILRSVPRPFSRRALGCLQRVGRIQHGESGGRPRLARRARGRPRIIDRHAPRRCGHHPHLLGERRRRLAYVVDRRVPCGHRMPNSSMLIRLRRKSMAQPIGWHGQLMGGTDNSLVRAPTGAKH